ncbi:thrombospondin [Micromonospora sp. HNM0581]|uniref:thrombospondin n=1 Tax=Micromonospora sp. HNM0581 TaxID=2716341 RepID=UPI00146BB70A|nr:thrombospondin [Micromonospora sp. HNM0581]NLU76848.1 thrombospondin [Micromonospora sp. HNM0581]
MKFPSLSRRDESVPSTEDDRNHRGTVATDTRPDDTGSIEPGRAPSGNTVVFGRASADRDVAEGSDRAAQQPDAERTAEARAATARSTMQGSRRARAATNTTDADGTVEGRRTANLDRTLDSHRTADGDRIADTVEHGSTDDHREPDAEAGRKAPPAPVGPRPRASMLATLGLVVGVGGFLSVLTGALAGYGIALGAVGAVLAVFGLMATRRRHVAGKSDALLGIAFGLGAVVLGVLAMTGQYDWPTTDGDTVVRFREWLDSQFVDRL